MQKKMKKEKEDSRKKTQQIKKFRPGRKFRNSSLVIT